MYIKGSLGDYIKLGEESRHYAECDGKFHTGLLRLKNDLNVGVITVIYATVP